jgi:hypothetical protein
MPAGLQVWDASGNLIFDTGDRLSRRVASVAIAAGSTGSVTVPGTDPIWYYVSNRNSVGNASTYTPTITQSGRTISWVPNGAYSLLTMVDVILVYGVF